MTPTDSETLSPFITQYIRSRRRQGTYTKTSGKDVTSRLATLSRSFGRRPLVQLTEHAMYRWLEDIGHLSPNSRSSYFASARTFLRWMVRNGHLQTDPTANMGTLKRLKGVPRAQSSDAVAALFAACEDNRDRAVVWLMVGLGLRRGEVARLHWEDYDERRQVLLVKGKNEKERLVPVIEEVAGALRRIRMHTRGPVVRSKLRGQDGVSPAAIGSRLTYLMREAGLKNAPYDGVSAHALRHTAATDVLEECHDLRIVQQLLGHEDLSTTAIYLGRVELPRMREAMRGRDYTHQPYDWRNEDEAPFAPRHLGAGVEC